MRGCILVARKKDHHCGCIEEEWDTPIGYIFMHIKPDFTAEVYIDNGDAEWDLVIAGSSFENLRIKLAEYIKNLPVLH